MSSEATHSSRRRVIWLIGATSIGTALAGCLDPDDEEEEDGEVDDGAPEDEAPEDDEVDMEALEDHLEDANGWEGETQDHTGEEELTIEVGDPEGGSNYVYDPVAPEVDAGTEVTWEWVDDADHSVTDTDGDFDSGVQSDATFEHTFEEAGTYLYLCQPHQAQGHLGAVVVHE